MKNKKHNKLHKYNRTLCSVALSSALAVVAVGSALPMVAQASDNVGVTATTGRTLYVGDNLGPTGAMHFRELESALNQANVGDTIVLTSNVQHRETATEGLQIPKNVTIDGKGSYTLSIRASVNKGIDLHGDLTLKDLTLNITGESSTPGGVINVGGHHLKIENVSTNVYGINEEKIPRPEIIGGKGKDSNAHTRITIIGGSSETSFQSIYAGDKDSDTTNDVTISIQSRFAKVKDGIKLGGKGHNTQGVVNVETNSQNITNIDGTGSSNNHVTFTDTTILQPVRIPGVQNLSVKGANAGLTIEENTNISGTLEVTDGANLSLGNPLAEDVVITVGRLKGDDKSSVSLKSTALLTVNGDVEGNTVVKVDAKPNDKKAFVTINGSSDGLTVKPEHEDSGITFEKRGNSFTLKSDVSDEGSSDEHSSEDGDSSSVTPPPPPAPPAPPAKPETDPSTPTTPPEESPAPPGSQPQNPPLPEQPESSGSQDPNANQEGGSETTHDGNNPGSSETHAPGAQGENGGSGDDKQGENNGTTDTSSGDTDSGSNGPDTSNTGSGAGSADTGVGSVGTDGTASGNATGGPNGSDTGATESTNGLDAADTSSGGVQNGSNQDTPAADDPDADNQADEPAAEPKKENEPAPESDKEGANKEEANNDSSSSTEGSSSQPADLPKPAEKSIKDRIMDTLKGLFTENNLDEKQQQSAVEKTAESLNDLAATYTDYDFSFSLDAARVAENRLNDLAALNGLESAANDNYAFLAQSAKALKTHNSVWVSSSLAEQRGDRDSKRRLSTINLGYDRQFDNLLVEKRIPPLS